MFKFVTFLFVIILCGIFYLALYNMSSVDVYIGKQTYYAMPKIALIVISSAFGFLFMMFIFFVNDTRRFILTKRLQKQQKREELIENHHSRAVSHLLAKRYKEAIEEFENALGLNPDHTTSLQFLGDIYYETSDFSRACDYYKKVITIDGDNPEAMCKLSMAFKALGRMDDAIVYAGKALEIDSSNMDALHAKRTLFEKLLRWEDLVTLQKTILKLDSSDKEEEKKVLLGYKYEYGRQNLENNNLENARRAFKTVIKLDNHFIPAHLGYAEVILSEGGTEEAMNYLEEVHRQTKSIIPLIRLEDLLINLGDPARLLKIYRTSISGEKDNDILRFFLGKLYYRLEMLDDAMDTFNTFDIGVTYPEVYKLRGSIYLKHNQPDKAAEEFLKVIEMKKALRIPYTCSHCKYVSPEWSGRCPGCNKWNTYSFDLLRSWENKSVALMP
ncbi:MAG: tetratricopeptide repeat protein [Nitrospirae bacterium]|nr:tetratricopeptide repeat protein [Nitrospirota bacterium]